MTLNYYKFEFSQFQRCIDYADIVWRSSAMGSTMRIQWAKMAISNLYTQMVSNTATVSVGYY